MRMTDRAASLPIRIYYEDTDFSGLVYHARYLHFLERGRTEALRALGIDQRALHEAEGGPFAFVVRRMTIAYHLPARMDDLVTVETALAELRGASILMRQRLERGGACLCEAEVTIAFLARGKVGRMAKEMRDKLATITNA